MNITKRYHKTTQQHWWRTNITASTKPIRPSNVLSQSFASYLGHWQMWALLVQLLRPPLHPLLRLGNWPNMGSSFFLKHHLPFILIEF